MSDLRPGVPNREDPYRYQRGWSPAARLWATQTVREVLAEASDLLGASEGFAEVVRECLNARSVSITLIEGDDFRDLVNVGRLAPDQVRFPVDQRYPLSSYPATTERLLSHEGYLSTSSSLEVVREYIAQSPRETVGCFMGLPIAALGEVRGELFAFRDPDVPVFLPADLDIARDLATQFGAQLPDLLQQQAFESPDW
ncbi:MAG TPA: hypothetical protein VMT88_10400 [Actinomycetes bacterium]|nr:hypothetical protein [Actinomycetes bacterium]